jgi:uncharacterized protein
VHGDHASSFTISSRDHGRQRPRQTCRDVARRYTRAVSTPGTVDDIARRHRLALVVQFGSTVSGTLHQKSDVDVAVLYDRAPPSFEEQSRVAEDLQSLFPGRELDLAIIDRADPLFLKQIFERGRLLAGSARRFAEMKIYAFKRYQDHRRYLGLERKYVQRVIREHRS